MSMALLPYYHPSLIEAGCDEAGRGCLAGSVYAAARWERKYEEVLPLTCCAMVLTMFLFGVFGFLKLGAAVVCAALVCTVVLAKLVGCTLPMAAKKLGFDPAVMASPFITTIVDALSLLLYFQIASLLLGV